MPVPRGECAGNRPVEGMPWNNEVPVLCVPFEALAHAAHKVTTKDAAGAAWELEHGELINVGDGKILSVILKLHGSEARGPKGSEVPGPQGADDGLYAVGFMTDVMKALFFPDPAHALLVHTAVRLSTALPGEVPEFVGTITEYVQPGIKVHFSPHFEYVKAPLPHWQLKDPTGMKILQPRRQFCDVHLFHSFEETTLSDFAQQQFVKKQKQRIVEHQSRLEGTKARLMAHEQKRGMACLMAQEKEQKENNNASANLASNSSSA